ncbi:MAG: HAD family hydrolase [Candidatus Obscuribacterales bacterium]|jgi:RNA polymerase II subunit A small phosphatase-like protein
MVATKPLLILDLDETLIRGATAALDRAPEMVLAHYFVYFRPHVTEFLAQVNENFTLALWSSATMAYIAPIARAVWKGLPDPLFVWDRSYCTIRYDFHQGHEYYIKDLRKVAAKGIDLGQILMVDDELRKVSYQYANAICVRQFLGESDDRELLDLASYLETIREFSDFRKIDKSNWRQSLNG